MSQEMRLHERLGGLVSESKVLLRPSDKGPESRSVCHVQMLFASWRLASSIASSKAEQHEELKPGDPHTSRSINRYDS